MVADTQVQDLILVGLVRQSSATFSFLPVLGLCVREQDQQNKSELNKHSSDGEGLALAHSKGGMQSSAGVQGHPGAPV